MKIGELAKKTGCKAVTIRWYEKEGFLPLPERAKGNYRIYGKKDLERLEFILHCRRHGLKPAEVKKLLAFRDHPRQDCAWITELITAHIAEINKQIASLRHLKKHLEHLQQSCDGDGNGCGILQNLTDQSCCASCIHCAPNAGGHISLIPILKKTE